MARKTKQVTKQVVKQTVKDDVAQVKAKAKEIVDVKIPEARAGIKSEAKKVEDKLKVAGNAAKAKAKKITTEVEDFVKKEADKLETKKDDSKAATTAPVSTPTVVEPVTAPAPTTPAEPWPFPKAVDMPPVTTTVPLFSEPTYAERMAKSTPSYVAAAPVDEPSVEPPKGLWARFKNWWSHIDFV